MSLCTVKYPCFRAAPYQGAQNVIVIVMVMVMVIVIVIVIVKKSPLATVSKGPPGTCRNIRPLSQQTQKELPKIHGRQQKPTYICIRNKEQMRI